MPSARCTHARENDKIYQFDPGRLSMYYHSCAFPQSQARHFRCYARLCLNKKVPDDGHHRAIDTNRHSTSPEYAVFTSVFTGASKVYPPKRSDNIASQHEYVFLWFANSKENPFSQEKGTHSTHKNNQ